MTKKYCSHYNIHDFLTITINSIRPINDLDREFEFFKCKSIGESNIKVNIHNFKPNIPDNYYVLDSKFYISDNYIFYKDTEGCANWKLELIGLETDEITINFYSDYNYTNYSQKILNPNFLIKDILLRIIEYMIFRMKNTYLLHSAGLDKNSTAVLLAGRGGSFKTTLTMDFIRYNNFNLLGDDHVLCTSNKKVFSFPENLSIFQYMLNNLETEKSWTILKKLELIYYLKKKRIKISPDNISVSSNLNFIIFIIQKNQSKVEIRKLSNLDNISRRLIFNNVVDDLISPYKLRITTGLFLKCLLAYSYVFPQSTLSKMYESIERNIYCLLKDTEIFEITIPLKYNFNVSGKIRCFVEHLLEECV